MPAALPEVCIDRVDVLNLLERQGKIRSLTRKVRVIFPSNNRPNDYSVLMAALNQIPQLVAFSTLPDVGLDTLALVEREANLSEEEPCLVDVVCKYEHILDGPNQQLPIGQAVELGEPVLYGKGRASITQKSSNFYYPDGDPANGKHLILVAHTFKSSDQTMSGVEIEPGYPNTQFQAGEISQPYPEANYHLEGVVTTNSPWKVAFAFIAKVNDDFWMEQRPYSWLCSSAGFEVLSKVNHTYKFSFEWQFNIDTWRAEVVFNDQRTGRPPADVQDAQFAQNVGPNNIPVMNSALNPIALNPVVIQPAGHWFVPNVKAVNFPQLLGSFLEVPGG